ncbi:MAG: NAD(P)H-dependent glycerol-3-phosphate dehydrogenase [Muribaculum sp.]|nr:NAD(P)H-dependent glycerol-3-phosphate dehydrogenase [Muribaculum sp.]
MDCRGFKVGEGDSCPARNPGVIAVMGGGSWATALAKLLMQNCRSIIWYMRRPDRIAEFRRLGHNPAYLSDVEFPIGRIDFRDNINDACREADTLLMAMPSPYFKSHLEKLTEDISGKNIVIATKGIIPGENMLVSDYIEHRYGITPDRITVVSGPCHAEEVALGRLSYLTVASTDIAGAESFARCIRGNALRTLLSSDVRGIEYAGVLKNVYAVGAGIIHGMKAGDNFLAIMVSNAACEMSRFINEAVGGSRNITDSVYLGDLLVTAYSKFSRNHNFGSMIGRGMTASRAIMEMEMVTEGYYAAKCMHEINEALGVEMPILEGIYEILYRETPMSLAIDKIASRLI